MSAVADLESLKELEPKELQRRILAGHDEIVKGLEQIREHVLGYDAADDKHGEKWDAQRVLFDVNMRLAIETIQMLKTCIALRAELVDADTMRLLDRAMPRWPVT